MATTPSNINIATAHQGETISHIAYRMYGTSRGYVEDILALNPALCELPAMLPMGTQVKLPAKTASSTKAAAIPSINLWD